MEIKLKNIIISVLSLNVIYSCESANILVYLPTPGRSHFKPMQPLFKELAKRGHNVTVISMFPLEKKITNYNDIHAPSISFRNFSFAELSKQNTFHRWMSMHNIIEEFSSEILDHEITKNFLRSKNTTFDLIFVELYHVDKFFCLGAYFNAPIIGLSFQPMLSHYDWIFKNSNEFSNIPHSYLPFTDRMYFIERLINIIFKIFSVIFYNFVSVPKNQEKVNEILQSINLNNKVNKKIDDILKNVSLVLTESHFSIDYVKSKMPNIIDIGGIHIETFKALPKDLQDFMDNAVTGVIYFSLGSLMEPTHLKTLGSKFSRIFRKLPYKVIWKWKPELLDDIPENVLVREWLPQLDILSHRNCILFMSHGGYHSVVETIHVGLPILAIPLFNDQEYNTALIEKFSIGKRSNFQTSEEDFVKLIKELIENKKYRENAKQRSKIYKDRPQSPLDAAVYWTEYVIRHKGAHHMKSAAVDLPWYQYIMLDIIAFLILVVFIFCYIVRLFFILLYYAFLKFILKLKVKSE